MIPTETDFEAEFSLETEAIPLPEDPPFHILFMGDYSGRQNLLGNFNSGSGKHPVFEIDRDNFEDVMGKLNITLRLDLSAKGHDYLTLNFRELDDFHPDQIFRQIPLFSDLRDTRQRLLDPNSFESAAREVRSWFEKDEDDPSVENISAKGDSEPESSGNLLDDILSGNKTDIDSYETPPTKSVELNKFIKDIVRPHIIHTDEDEQASLLEIVDETTGELMRGIIHHKDFQELEAAWRSLYFVVRKTETNKDLKLFVMDISKDEVADNLKSVSDLTDSVLYRQLVIEKSQKVDNEPWALLCGNYEFALNVDDVATLIRMAKIGNTLTAPFITQIRPQMLGIDSLAEKPSSSDWNLSDETNESKLWTMLRTIPEAASLGLGLPGFLTRLPYGEQTEPTEAFSFEEFTEISEHTNYVWGNPSFAYALLHAQSFSSYGWEMSNRVFNEIEGLPTHIYSEDGEAKTKSCAEINMTHEGCNVLIEQGLMPLLSFRNSDSIKFAEFQSIKFPSQILTSRWS
jgi:type VI secretion system protein ImpC